MTNYSDLWVDDGAAESIALRINLPVGSERENFKQFVSDGYTILESAVPIEQIDSYLNAISNLDPMSDEVHVTYGVGQVTTLKERSISSDNTRVVDSYMFCKEAIDVLFAPAIKSFLETIFQQKACVFQSLHFNVGSEQAVHQDTAYVVVEQPGNFAAAWIALEDIKPGSGELVYYPGSHRLPHYEYSNNSLHWNRERDGDKLHDQHLKWIHDEARKQKMSLLHFRPKKGDVLIWHSSLAHGGGVRSDRTLSRQALVGHFFPLGNVPHFAKLIHPQNRAPIDFMDGAMTSYYYDHSRAMQTLRRQGVVVSRHLKEASFDEKFYLDTNPDVDQGVKIGQWKSAREHFEIIGRFEGRVPFIS